MKHSPEVYKKGVETRRRNDLLKRAEEIAFGDLRNWQLEAFFGLTLKGFEEWKKERK